MPRRFSLLLMMTLLVTATRAADKGPTYVIHFDDPDRKGDRASFERVAAMITDSSTRWDGIDQPQEHETVTTMHLLGEWEVLETDKWFNSTAESMTVKSWTRKLEEDGRVSSDKEVLPAGSKILARMTDDGAKYTVDGAEPDDADVESLLPSVLILHHSGERSGEGTMFGGLTPRKVGDVWPVDAKAAVAVYRESQIDVRPQDVSGTVNLLGVETYDGTPCLHVAVDVKLAEFRPVTTRPSDREPQVHKPVKGSMTSHIEWLIDAAGSEKHWAQFSTTRKFQGEGTTRGRQYTTEQTVRHEVRIRRLSGSHTATTTTTTTPAP